MREKLRIQAVREKDLRQILDRFGLSTKIDNSEISCMYCGTELTWENVGAAIVVKESLLLCCERPECIEFASSRGKHGGV